MNYQINETKFLPADRNFAEELQKQNIVFQTLPFFQQIIDAIPNIVLMLNENRQIVAANKTFHCLPEIEKIEPVLGLRPGEALQCIHADNETGGCGTSEFCRHCGAADSIRASQKGKVEVRECRISRKNGLGVLDLRVQATPLSIENQHFSFFVISDISHEKRRRALERIFFHDILNIAGNIRGFSEILKLEHPEIQDAYVNRLYSNIEMLVEEIKAQKVLTAAENDELIVYPTLIDPQALIREIIELYKFHRHAGKRHLHMDENSESVVISTDITILRRVLGNMVSNALEASKPDEVITMGCMHQEDEIEFYVHNPGVIPHDVQLQIFKRSYSTKSTDRGLGTYSMKLLTERYLKGGIWFTSSENKGTIFKAILPIDLDTQEQ